MRTVYVGRAEPTGVRQAEAERAQRDGIETVVHDHPSITFGRPARCNSYCVAYLNDWRDDDPDLAPIRQVIAIYPERDETAEARR